MSGDQRYIDAARREYEEPDAIVIDGNAKVLRLDDSDGDEPAAWVQAWVYVGSDALESES